MLKLCVLKPAVYICARHVANIGSQECVKEKWDIISSVSLERRPVVARELNDLEKKVHNMLREVEFERSHKSDFELRLEADQRRDKEIKDGVIGINEIDNFPKQTGQDFIDAALEELKRFELGKRVNSAAVENDTKSLKRALDRYLLLLVYENIGRSSKWILPQGKHLPGETLRETAERVLQEKCGTGIKAQFFGNAPFGFYKYKYPNPVRTGETVGAKIFFFKAQISSGQVQTSQNFMWATRKELEILPTDYLRSVKMFLIDEEH